MRLKNPFKPDPAPPAFGAGKTVPEVGALWPSRLILQWLSPFLRVGYSRPLEKDDLWSLPNRQLSEPLADQLERRFYDRCEPKSRPKALRSDIPAEEKLKADGDADVEQARVPEGTTLGPEDTVLGSYDASLFKALCSVHQKDILISGTLHLVADTLQTVTPLVLKVFLNWLVASYTYARLDDASREVAGLDAPRGVGYGIGLAFAIFIMQQSGSLMSQTSYKLAMSFGQSMRTALIGVLYRKSLRISGKTRMVHNTGKIITMISTDATNVEMFAGFAHPVWVAPIQIALGIGLLIGTLGYSALAGLGVIVVALPLEGLAVWVMYIQREKAIKVTDKRVQLTSEVLQGIRLIKCYGWEAFFAQRISELRGQEVKAIRKSAVALAVLFSLFECIPVLSAVVSFITYSVTGHDLNIATIFAALQLFNVLRIPLLLLPLVLSNMSSAMIGLNRMSEFLISEDLGEPYLLEPNSSSAIRAHGDFSWEAVPKPDNKDAEKKDDTAEKAPKQKSKPKSKSKEDTTDVLPSTSPPSVKEDEKPFELKGLHFTAPKGAFVAIVGRIGSGKSSVLQALIGEMKRTSGQVVVGASLAYLPQTPWIQNTTLRNNITFGLPEDEERLREVIHCCGLEPDIAVLPHGELTEIGEKGINLSGGQKARISLARAAYSTSDIVLLDDPLSAVDAHVGRFILDNCLLNGPLASRTRVLVTHALHVLDRTDYIYMMENGSVVEEGRYEDLMSRNGSFTRLIDDYGRVETADKSQDASLKKKAGPAIKGESEDSELKKAKDALMQLEERSVGAVDWKVYRTWLIFAGGVIWLPIMTCLLFSAEAVRVATNLWLSFWTSNEIAGFENWKYIAVYAGFGVAISLFVFILAFAFFVGGLIASLRIFKAALNGILRSPIAFFDTTPIGRILSRFSKDQESLDNEVANVLYSFLSIFVSVFGVFALVIYTFPYLGIAFLPLGLLYYFASVYYRASSVEAKRLDAILRSSLYATISETLTGLSTIRAYGVQNRSLQKASDGLDMENRAYYMFIVLQRWLGLRLDFFGNVLVLGIGLFAVGFRNSVNPASVGVVLTYTLSFTGIFSEMVAQFAQNEQNMNSVERVVHYTTLEPEGDLTTPHDPVPGSWPTQGEVEFKDVELAYRPGLPLVLKGVSFSVRSKEKIGIVGRTGAGKSSLIQALFRTVELSGGAIEVDGVDISKIGLDALRSNLALVPQDNVLFLGTLRQNLDPQGSKTDAELLSALQRVSLLPPPGATDVVADDKFSLDAKVGDEGSNYSAGEKQLLALCRALVRNNRIIDEATSNVDVETDAKVQRTIQTEFSSATLLCIAHRLNTIAFYDRVLVMSAGVVAEFDTVLNLYDKPDSTFRALCDEANLSRTDIVRIREEREIS